MEKRFFTCNMVLFQFTLKSCLNLIESFIFMVLLVLYSGKISLISSFPLKQVNGLELLCLSQHFSTLTDADIMLKPVLTCIFICHDFGLFIILKQPYITEGISIRVVKFIRFITGNIRVHTIYQIYLYTNRFSENTI